MFYVIRSRARCAGIAVLASAGIFFMASSVALESGAESKSPTMYPKTLTGAEVTDHFARIRVIEGVASGNVGLRNTFTLKLKSNGWYDGRSSSAWGFAGKWKVSDSKFCLTHESGNNYVIDLSGCYVVQQTGERSFLLTGANTSLRYNEGGGPVSANPAVGAPAAVAPVVRESAEPILIDISERKISAEAFKEMATKALTGRGWKVIKAEGELFEGVLVKDYEYRVRILFRPGAMIKIAYVENYGKRSQSWLQNLSEDIQAEMARSGR